MGGVRSYGQGTTQEKQRSRRRACSLCCCCCCCYVHHEQLAASDPTLVDHKCMTQVTKIREKLPDILEQAGSVVVHAMSDLWRMEESTIVNGPRPRLVFLPSRPFWRDAKNPSLSSVRRSARESVRRPAYSRLVLSQDFIVAGLIII